MKPSIIRLRALEKQLYAYLYAMTVIDFDAETVAPEGSADGRAEACEVLSRASFDLLSTTTPPPCCSRPPPRPRPSRSAPRSANLQRQYDQIAKIPADEYAAFTKLCNQSIPAWSRPSARTISACLRRIWKRSWPPAGPRPIILPRTATPMRSCWTGTRRA